MNPIGHLPPATLEAMVARLTRERDGLLELLAASQACGSLVWDAAANAWRPSDQRAALAEVNEELLAQNDELEARAQALVVQADQMAFQRELMARLVEHVPAGIGYLDASLVLRWFNPALEQVARCQAGKPFLHQLPGRSRPAVGPALGEVFREGHAVTLPDFGGDEGTVAWDLALVPVPGATGDVEGILVFAVDVTLRNQATRTQRDRIAHLQHLDRSKDEFLATVSHELRTPLSFIMGYASILNDGLQGELTPAQKASLGKIAGATERMLRLIEDLLDVARIQAGKAALVMRPQDYGAVIREVVGAMAVSAEGAGIVLEREVPAALAGALDAGRVTQVLTNLIANAIKFTAPGGRVEVHAYRRDRFIVTEVRDTGCGIPPGAADRIFQKFEQVDMSATRTKGGIGLGLAIARGLVEAHGGTIGVESAEGRGSTFWFTLPVAA